MILLQQMLAISGMMLIGYFGGKKGVLNEKETKAVSWLVVNIANVALIIKAGLSDVSGISKQNFILVGCLAVAVYAALLLIAAVLPAVLKAKRGDRGIYRVMFVFSNIGFMGIPLLSALSGAEAVLYYTFFQLVFCVLIYTYGIVMIQKDAAYPEDAAGAAADKNAGAGTTAGDTAAAADKNAGAGRADAESVSAGDAETGAVTAGNRRKPWWRQMFNAGLIACMFSLVFFFCGVKLPGFVTTLLENLSGLTLPLSMIVIGQSFTGFHIKELFTDVRLILFSVIKLIVVPVAGLFLIRQFVANDAILILCMVVLSTPAGSMTAMMAQQYDGNFKLASKGVALTTLLSVATMPLVSLLTGI